MRCTVTTLLLCATLLATVGNPSRAFAQPDLEPSTAAPAAATEHPKTDAVAPGPDDGSDMRQMAKSMTAMADMCRMMMEREMKGWPLKMAAGVIIGILLVAALVLFVMLEIQWIRYWKYRNTTEERSAAATSQRQEGM